MDDGLAQIGQRMVKGAAWMVGLRLAMRVIGLISTIILARLLVPEDFGLVAIATTVVGGLEIISEFGFDVVLIRDQRGQRHHYDTVWTLSIIRGGLIAVMLVGAAGPAAGFFGDARLEAIFYLLAVGSLLDGARNVGTVDFRKELQFDREFRFLVYPKLAAFFVTIALAWLWRDYWALVAGIMVGKVTMIVASYTMHPYRPRLSFDSWRQIVAFSKWLLLNHVTIFAFQRGDTFAIGRIINAQAVGIYSIAHEIATLATSELLAPVRRALIPGFAKLGDDLDELRAKFLQVWSFIFMIGAPMAVGCGLVADPLVRIALGPNWLGAIPLIEILCLFGLFSLGSSLSQPVYIALGRPRRMLLPPLLGLAIFIPALVWGTMSRGVTGAAIALTATTAISVAIDMVLVARAMQLPAFRLVAIAWRSVVSLAFMAALVRLVDDRWVDRYDIVDEAIRLSGLVCLGAASYVGVHLLLWLLSGKPDSAEARALALLRGRFLFPGHRHPASS